MKEQVVRDIQLRKGIRSNELIKEFYNAGGFTAKKIAVGVDILESMMLEKNCTICL